MDARSLVFVYHTDANPVSLVGEFAREVFTADGYQCSLCHLTYNKVRKNPEWTRYVRALPLRSSFHLRSRFLRKHPDLADRTYPAVFVEDASGALHDFLDADELRTCATVQALMAMIDERLAARRVTGPATAPP